MKKLKEEINLLKLIISNECEYIHFISKVNTKINIKLYTMIKLVLINQ
jgi:hypothetical protein